MALFAIAAAALRQRERFCPPVEVAERPPSNHPDIRAMVAHRIWTSMLLGARLATIEP
jgi:hypothetical protein